MSYKMHIKFQIFFIFIFLKNAEGNSSVNHGRYKYGSYNQITVCSSEYQPIQPQNLFEIQEIIKYARKAGKTIKALGNQNSATDIICTNGIPVGMQNIHHFSYDHKSGLATVGAGSTLERFLDSLHKLGRTVHGIPMYGKITIGGAIATGAHGSSFETPSSLSDQIVRIVVIDGLGNLKNISDHETLRAFRAHLGLLGIIYEVTFPTIPQYKVHVRHFAKPDHLLWDGTTINKHLNSSDRFQFFWFPSSQTSIMSVSTRTDEPGNCQSNFIRDTPSSMLLPFAATLEGMQEHGNHVGYFAFETLAKMSLNTKRRAIGNSIFTTEDGKQTCPRPMGYVHKMYANSCRTCPWHFGVYNMDITVIIPLAELPNAIQTMREIWNNYPVEFPLTGIFFRFLSAGDGVLSTNSGRDSVGIDWVGLSRKQRFTKPVLGLPAAQAMMQALITKHGGRPHWGKGGPVYTQPSFLKKMYPELQTFIDQMNKFDPHGVFLNEFGRRLKFSSNKNTMTSYASHCALLDACICQNNNDCGDGSEHSYICGKLLGYSVCREREVGIQQFRNIIQRNLINRIARLLSHLD